jgi:enoyl-CoA hydratase/carnithine racemase
MAKTTSILTRTHDSVLYLTLNRPAALNAIDLDMAEALKQHLITAATNPEIRAIVITGSDRAFCAGGDLKFAVQVNPETPGNCMTALKKFARWQSLSLLQ